MSSKPTTLAPGSGDELRAEDVFGEQLLTTEQVAKLFHTAEATIRDWINRGEVPAVKWGKRHYISVSDLRRAKEAKEREQHLVSERHQRQKREPGLWWEVTYCLECGTEPVLTTRHMRLDGDVWCANCRDKTSRSMGIPFIGTPYLTLTKDGWERKIRMLVDEHNRDVGTEETALGQGAKWLVHHCGLCGKPRDVRREDLADVRFYPQCDHALPFTLTYQLEGIDPDEPQPIEVSAFAQFAAQELARTKPGEGWKVCTCAHCGAYAAVAKREQRLTGVAICRLCFIKKIPTSSFHRNTIVAAALKEDEHAPFKPQPQLCACDRWEIVDVNKAETVILSWCAKRSQEEREQLARAYGQALSLSDSAVQRLLYEVSVPTGVPSSWPDLDSLPF